MAPQLWDAVRFAIDRRGEAGQFILTGASPTVEGAHSGVGRISQLVHANHDAFRVSRIPQGSCERFARSYAEGLIDANVTRIDSATRRGCAPIPATWQTQASQATIAAALAHDDTMSARPRGGAKVVAS